MDPSRSNRILREWSAVASAARRPAAAPRGVAIRSGIPTLSFAGMGVLALALVVAVAWLGTRGPSDPVGSAPPASVAAVASPADTAHPTPKATPNPTVKPTAKPTAKPTPPPTIGACDPARLVARITRWEGAAGSRIADVELRNAGVECTLEAMERPQLVDGGASVLINGKSPTSTTILTLKPGDVVTTLVQASNYCGADPQPPVTVSFVLDDGHRIVAAPVSATDATVPPCMGSGSGASIEMHPWSK